ncbi:GldG family protein [Anaeromicropila herbilytica]|uniref:ABC-type uncharacterized transport system domain-containing protein n=1 Tax=Anaeromicropila herbilytica TaxID=2785025 RepID=A0A7R7EJ95_9FIRM|nr:GldG family protein [Anaeromicropila herbilytica]BCN29817.1 hypothetical protein bsdtb5_11120 [Anaeromicropila herbilytica]
MDKKYEDIEDSQKELSGEDVNETNHSNDSIANTSTLEESSNNESIKSEQDALEEISREILEERTNDSTEKKNKKKLSIKIKDSFTSRKFRSGAYSTMISAVVIAIVLIFNLIAGELDLKVDLSSNSIFTLTKTTKNLVKNIKDDVTIYYIAGENSQKDQVKEIVDKYKTLSSKIKVETKDPVLYPTFTSAYTSDDVADKSVIVVNNKTKAYKYVKYSDMLQYTYDSSYNPQVTGVDVEGQITSAIQYVTSTDLPKIYTLEGHNEAELGTTITNALKKQNVSISTLKLLSKDAVPEDCSLLVINGPIYDFTKEEVEKVKAYLEKGGKAIILADYTKESMPNFSDLLEYYGVKLCDGVVIEGDSNNYMSGNPAYLIPTIESHDITKSISDDNKAVVVPAAKGLQQVDTLRSTLTIDKLLTTSDSAFSKVDMNSSSYQKEDNDISGPFNLGVLATDKYNNKESKVVIYASSYLIDDKMTQYDQLGNSDLFISTVNYLTDKQNNLSIPVRSLEEKHVTLTSTEANTWGTIAVFIIPLMFLGTGIVVTLRRRKK